MTKFIGIDIAKKKCVVCVSDQDNTVVEKTSYRNTSWNAAEFAKHAAEAYGECRAVVESTGNMWLKTYEAFESEGIGIKLANPLKTRIIAESKIKTDKIDARVLSTLLRGDLIAECYVPAKKVRLSRALLGHRVNITKEQTRTRNRIHALLSKYDLECEYNDISCAHGIAWLKSDVTLDDHDQEILDSLVRQLEFLREEEKKASKVIAKDAVKNEYVPIIMSMPGFDYYSASFLAAYIADIKRFPSPSRLVSWVGLCPSVHQTGETLHMGKMKGGSKKTCWIMVQAANAAIRADPRLQQYYERKVKRRGLHHNVALTHVGNKMLRILWHMLRENRLYDQRNEQRDRSKLKRLRNITSE